jgi:NTP pyrophosphatase (non-canonical NTP hydrolase)
MTINEMRDAAFKNSADKGFYAEPATLGDRLMLMVSELAEVLEEYRNHHAPTEIYYNPEKPDKPEGIPIELADTVIRIGDFCGFYGIDLEAAVDKKMAFNSTRSYRHGGKKL